MVILDRIRNIFTTMLEISDGKVDQSRHKGGGEPFFSVVCHRGKMICSGGDLGLAHRDA